MRIDECVYSRGSAADSISDEALAEAFIGALKAIGPRHRVLALPPDGTRNHAKAGVLLKAAFDFYGDSLAAVMPALGTHRPMSDSAVSAMFPGVPLGLFRPHDWRRDVVELGRVPEDFVRQVSEGLCTFDWPAQVNRLVVSGGFDLVLSLGQVVPHEVVGMANYTKNLFVGVGGKDGIDRSHWIGAAYGIERTLGRVETPVRAVLDYAQERFASAVPLLYALTVVGPDGSGGDATRGLFVGAGSSAFRKAAALSAEVNIEYLAKPAGKVVVYLDPESFKSTWLGNKAIYRTRLAIADGGELLVLAPGIDSFGEDKAIDETIRDYGYCGVEQARALVESGELAGDLAGAAHLAHGSTDGRFSVTYAAGGLSRAEIEDVGYDWADCHEALARYSPGRLADGWNVVEGEEIFFVRNPALGLWATRERFGAS
ncbi:MAG: D-mannonate epimerase [Spirochaetes bacterium]|nr:D-mannonate epimerase [Spirochaetota bacterium]MBU1081127.1 D-mannonate epimerase [Spirochaetota bacterium]